MCCTAIGKNNSVSRSKKKGGALSGNITWIEIDISPNTKLTGKTVITPLILMKLSGNHKAKGWLPLKNRRHGTKHRIKPLVAAHIAKKKEHRRATIKIKCTSGILNR